MPAQYAVAKSIRGIDLFCGAGGLTYGLEKAGIDMRLGIDADPACEYPYSANNRAGFLLQSVEETTPNMLSSVFGGSRLRLLAGCAPCQPFSAYNRREVGPSHGNWNLLSHFSRLVEETRPELVSMENVPPLRNKEVFKGFVRSLERQGYSVYHKLVNCVDYGAPQHRNRLVLLASRLGEISLVNPTTPAGRRRTVRSAIHGMPPLVAGQADASDPVHRSSGLSERNMERIRQSVPGGTWKDWDPALRAECHTRGVGRNYLSVYGRMSWDSPAPTITTNYRGYGNGRFGHPDQDRAISLREGAILQTFPRRYKFVRKGEKVKQFDISRIVGNAVPVSLGKAIGASLIEHVVCYM